MDNPLGEPSKPRETQDLPGTAQGRRLFVRNIGYRRRDELIRYYTKFLTKFGEVEYFDIVMDHIKKLPKGYGFVTFKHLESAHRALAARPQDLEVGFEMRVIEIYPAQTKPMTMVRRTLAKLKASREKAAKDKVDYVKLLLEGKIESEPESVEGERRELSQDCIDRLDDEVLLNIFDYLDIRDKTNCELVSRRWYHLTMHLWAAAETLNFKEAFALWGGPILDSMTLYQILKKCPNLKEINFNQTSTNLDEKTCDIIGRCCPNLEKLLIRDTELNKYSVTTIGKFCQKLKSIDFTKCGNVSEKGLWELFHLRPDLDRVVLSHCSTITGKCLYKVTNLTYLDLTGCLSVVPEAFSKLAQNCSQTLKTLMAPPLNSDGLTIICENFRNLELFQVEQSAEISHQFIVSSTVPLRGARCLSLLTQLRILRFSPELEDLNNESFYQIISNLPHLTELAIFGTDALTDLSANALPDYCEHIKILSLEGSKIGDGSLRCFSRLQNLEFLKVSGTLITDEGAHFIMSHAPNMDFLDVNSCLGISIKTLHYAYELVRSEVANKNLILAFNFCRIRISELATREDCDRFESRDIWASDEDDPFDEDFYDRPEDFYDHPEDEYIVDGDLESEEELT